jgi:uncharacterized protein YbaR (Trm112 family)
VNGVSQAAPKASPAAPVDDRVAAWSKSRSSMVLSPDLLSILACPACKGDLVYDAQGKTLTCNACRLRYRIENDIPVMLVEEAEKF